ncbi:MAG: hypothetical protein GY870_14145 [archaeon]|nr:hypothetical protein [archaeon]
MVAQRRYEIFRQRPRGEKIVEVLDKIGNIEPNYKKQLEILFLSDEQIDIFAGINPLFQYILRSLNLPRVGKSAKSYWIARGWSEKKTEEKRIKIKRGKSPMTVDFWIEKGLSESDAEKKIKSQRKFNVEYWIERGHSKESAISEVSKFQKGLSDKFQEKRSKNPENYHDIFPSQVDYWINKKGYTIDVAKEKVKESQTQFSKEICIEKYGEVEGLKIWEKRQEKWQQTMKSKSPEEQERIQRAKMNNGGQSYSKISQELFTKLRNQLYNQFPDMKFATLQENGIVNDIGTNNEFCLLTEFSCRFLDFYIPSIDKCIEFDGDYWHGKEGNKKRDEDRENEILSFFPNMSILHIKECDYRKSPEKIIKRCMEFIKND